MPEGSPSAEGRIVTIAGAAFAAAGAVAMLGGIAEAALLRSGLVLFTTNADIGSSLSRSGTLARPHVGPIERLSLFAGPGASLTVALVLAVAAVALVAAGADRPVWPWVRPAVMATAGMAAIVAAADVVLLGAVIGGVRLPFRFSPSTGHLAQGLAVLAPTLLAASTVAAVVLWLRQPEAGEVSEDPDEPWRPQDGD